MLYFGRAHNLMMRIDSLDNHLIFILSFFNLQSHVAHTLGCEIENAIWFVDVRGLHSNILQILDPTEISAFSNGIYMAQHFHSSNRSQDKLRAIQIGVLLIYNRESSMFIYCKYWYILHILYFLLSHLFNINS